MTQLKTKPNKQTVSAFLKGVEPQQKREACYTIFKLMQEVTGKIPQMWGNSVVGFGNYHYNYASGREGDWFMIGFSPRDQKIAIYFMPGFDNYDDFMSKLGTHTTGKSCLYIKNLEDVDLAVLRELMEQSVAYMLQPNAAQ